MYQKNELVSRKTGVSSIPSQKHASELVQRPLPFRMIMIYVYLVALVCAAYVHGLGLWVLVGFEI